MLDTVFSPDLLNIVGVALYLGSYAALQLGLVRGQGYLYPTINMMAASCVLASLIHSFNLSSAIIQAAWITISLVGITRMAFVNFRLNFTRDERQFADTMLQGLPLPQARMLLDIGLWGKAEPGTVFTQQGRPVHHLIYLAGGRADVMVDDKLVARCDAGAMIGEVTYLTGEPASATVRAADQVLCLRFDAATLRGFLSRNPDIRAVLEQNMANHLRTKLVSASNVASTAGPGLLSEHAA
ncbi:MAG: cyclic nucleotide-binding domain-containing protein [Alphaproteobacteria bacterium]|nr:cyclic nucleotide-binding domain-containing protein [Alphaproteobacteria bacterium]